MPSGPYTCVPLILKLITQVRPSSILDVGIGFGRYGLLAREYTDVMNDCYRKEDWKVKIVGIEVFEPYLTDVHRHIYDEIIIGNAIDILDNLPSFDVVLAADIIEHFPKEEGLIFLDKLMKVTSKRLIITTPGYKFPQGELFGNPYEEHKSNWRKDDFASRGFGCVDYDAILYCEAFKEGGNYRFESRALVDDVSMLIAYNDV